MRKRLELTAVLVNVRRDQISWFVRLGLLPADLVDHRDEVGWDIAALLDEIAPAEAV